MITPPLAAGSAAVLSEAVRSCQLLVGRYLAGFDDASCVAQRPERPNHAAWCLGHCALTMHRVAGMFPNVHTQPHQPPLPDADFAPGRDGSRAQGRFGTESVAFGSSPVDDPALYPGLARCVEVFNHACESLARVIDAASDADLNAAVPWGGGQIPLRMLVVRMVFHNGFHTGQIADLRRGLGLGSIFA